MYIQYKAKDGDTLDTIVKKHKIKDPHTVIKHPKNAKIADKLKKRQPLKKDTIVWIPDPNGKVYVVKTPSGKKVLNEQEYKAFVESGHRTMDRVYSALKIKYESATGRHDAQKKINDEHWFVSSVVGLFAKSEPTSSRGVATAAFKALESATKGRKYRDFSKLSVAADKAITKYHNEVHAWCGSLIGAAESSVTVLSGIRDAGAFCGTVAAVTITAPVSLPAAIAVGAASSGGVNLVYDGADAIGRELAGVKQRSAAEIRDRFIANAVVGAAGAAIVGKVMQVAGKPLAQALVARGMVTAQSGRLIASPIMRRVVNKEVGAAIAKLGGNAGTVYAPKAIEGAVSATIMKFFSRVGVGGVMKITGASKTVEGLVKQWATQNPKKVGQKDAAAVGKAAADDLAKGAATSVYEAVLQANMSLFEQMLREELDAMAKTGA